MSVQAISWVLSHSKSKLGARLVILSIANHARDDGTGAWPSVSTIAREAHLSERQVQYSLKILQGLGEIQRQVGMGPYGTSMYSLPLMGGAKSAPGGAVSVGRGCKIVQVGVKPIAPEPSLTVNKDKEEVFQLIADYHANVTYPDEHGDRYKISPSTRERVYKDSRGRWAPRAL